MADYFRKWHWRELVPGLLIVILGHLTGDSFSNWWNQTLPWPPYPPFWVWVAAAFVLSVILSLAVGFVQRGWMPYFAGVLLIGLSVIGLFSQPIKDVLPLVLLLVGLGLIVWTIWSRLTKTEGISIGNALPPVVLEDSLTGREFHVSGFIPKETDGMEHVDDEERGKVVEISREDAYVRYWRQLPLPQGTITVYIKLQEPFVSGIILGTGNWEVPPQPDLNVTIESDRILGFYCKARGQADYEWGDPLKWDQPLDMNRWYQVGVTWGPASVKMAVDGIVVGQRSDVTGPLHPHTTHFGIGLISPNEKAAKNVRLSELRVTNTQEF